MEYITTYLKTPELEHRLPVLKIKSRINRKKEDSNADEGLSPVWSMKDKYYYPSASHLRAGIKPCWKVCLFELSRQHLKYESHLPTDWLKHRLYYNLRSNTSFGFEAREVRMGGDGITKERIQALASQKQLSARIDTTDSTTDWQGPVSRGKEKIVLSRQPVSIF